METRAHHILIGFFTLTALTGLILFSLWLGQAGSNRDFHLYDVLFNEPVNGLSQGSPVQFSGITVGEVSRLQLDRTDPSKVWARIRISASTPVRTSTQARLTITNITGAAHIQLISRDNNSSLLDTTHHNIPVIEATPSPFSALLTGGEDLMSNINDLIINANSLFQPDNRQHFTAILKNFDTLTSTIVGERDSITTALQQLVNASKQAEITFSQSAQLMTKSNQLLNNKGQDFAEHLLGTMVALEQTANHLNLLLNNNQQSLNDSVNSLSSVLEELRRSLTTLRSISTRVSENPAGYLLGREQIKEVQPR